MVILNRPSHIAYHCFIWQVRIFVLCTNLLILSKRYHFIFRYWSFLSYYSGWPKVQFRSIIISYSYFVDRRICIDNLISIINVSYSEKNHTHTKLLYVKEKQKQYSQSSFLKLIHYDTVHKMNKKEILLTWNWKYKKNDIHIKWKFE